MVRKYCNGFFFYFFKEHPRCASQSIYLLNTPSCNNTIIFYNGDGSCRLMYSYLNRRLDRSLELQMVEASRQSGQSGHEGGKVVTSTQRPPLTPGRQPWYLFSLQTEWTQKRYRLRGPWRNLRFTKQK